MFCLGVRSDDESKEDIDKISTGHLLQRRAWLVQYNTRYVYSVKVKVVRTQLNSLQAKLQNHCTIIVYTYDDMSSISEQKLTSYDSRYFQLQKN